MLWTTGKAKGNAMKYIKLTNEADLVPRIHLELLGVSTKRDNDDTIGQFGSGTKFAPIYALRQGWEWINVGWDRHGGYAMSYNIADNEGIDVVQFQYQDSAGRITTKDSSYSMGAGELGWDHPFQIFREAFANALDAHYEFGASYDIDLVDEIGPPVDGEFSVYLTATEELIEVVDNFDKFFSLDRKPIFEDSKGNKIYEKLKNKEGPRVYHKGVLVYGPELDGSGTQSIFDYDLKRVELNEERRLKDISTNEMYAIARIFNSNENHAPGKMLPVIESIVDRTAYNTLSCAHGYWEWQFAYAWSGGMYEEEYGTDGFGVEFHRYVKRYVLPTIKTDRNRVAFVAEDTLNFDELDLMFKEKQVHPIQVSAGMYNLLNSTGASEHMDSVVMGEEFDTPFTTLSGDDLKFFTFAIGMVVNYDTDLLNYKIKVMKEQRNNHHIDGKALNINNDGKETIICVNQRLIDERKMERIVSTLVHELDHCITGARDGSRQFRECGDKRIGKLLMNHYCDKTELIQMTNETKIESDDDE